MRSRGLAHRFRRKRRPQTAELGEKDLADTHAALFHATHIDAPFARRQIVGINFEFRCNESWPKVKQLAHAGGIGTPAHLNWTFFGNALRGRKCGWINDGDLGGGWIGAYGVAVAAEMDRLWAGLRKSKRS